MQNLEPGECVHKEANQTGKHEVKAVNILPPEKPPCFPCSSFPPLATSSPASR